MGAFIVAALVFAITIAITAVTFFAAMMSETGLGGPNPLVPLGVGATISLLIVASHWMPHIGW